MEIIEFKKEGHDPQIDYIKGLCILFVVWIHCMNRNELSNILFPYWDYTAVPIFIIIQVFHYNKKGVSIRMPSISKLWKRIMKPYIIMVALMFIVQFFLYYDLTDGTFFPTLYWEKRGPGSYYIFIYIELYLFQYIYYATISLYVEKALTIIEYHPLQKILHIGISTIICIIPMIYKNNKFCW